MKRFEAKTTLSLMLPALALLGFASLLNARAQMESAPQVVKNELMPIFNSDLVCYRVIVTKNELPWWSRSLLGGRDFGAVFQSYTCNGVPIVFSREWEDKNFVNLASYIDRKSLKKGTFLFRTMITWKKNTNSQTRDQSIVLKKTVSLQDLKEK